MIKNNPLHTFILSICFILLTTTVLEASNNNADYNSADFDMAVLFSANVAGETEPCG